MDKLLRCPFCGGEPVSGTEFYESCGHVVKLSAYVRCKDCRIEKHKIFTATDVSFDTFGQVFSEVVNKWNQRVGSTDDYDG